MLVHTFYLLNLTLIVFSLLVFFRKKGGNRDTLSLVGVLIGLPLLISEYFALFYLWAEGLLDVTLFSETVFAFTWLAMSRRIHQVVEESPSGSRLFSVPELIIAPFLFGLSAYLFFKEQGIYRGAEFLTFRIFEIPYFSSFFLLLTMLIAAWRLEVFWRILSPPLKWEYKYFVVGGFLVCGVFIGGISYRLIYYYVNVNQFGLMAIILLFAWGLISYAIAKHRLLNRNIFISRKIVFSLFSPLVFAIYLLGIGSLSLLIRWLGYSLHFVLQGFLIVFGLAGIMVFILSPKMRRKVQFYISTNFYVNKYEYRDEWLAFSRMLQGLFSEREIIDALQHTLGQSLYTDKLMIWTGTEEQGFIKAFPQAEERSGPGESSWPEKDPLIRYLKRHTHFYTEEEERERDEEWAEIFKLKGEFLKRINIALLVPISIGEKLLGLVGLGREFTGGKYGQDDYDLLTALSTQAASAVLSVRLAEETARARQIEAWNAMSSFVLHDVKNAANMLSLVRQNAPLHLNNPDFQKDMLGAIDNALRRMDKVQDRLNTFKEDPAVAFQRVDVGEFIEKYGADVIKKIPGLRVTLNGQKNIPVDSNPEYLSKIFDNLLLNAREAGGEGTEVGIKTDKMDFHTLIEIQDNGPGIPSALLPDTLFEPFKTTKPNGTGIGLWQVKWMVKRLGGTIRAENAANGGAKFIINLPMAGKTE